MFSALDSAWHIATTRHQDALAEAARRQTVASALGGQDVQRRGAAALGQRIGAALVQVGQRLQGARPTEPLGGCPGALTSSGTSA